MPDLLRGLWSLLFLSLRKFSLRNSSRPEQWLSFLYNEQHNKYRIKRNWQLFVYSAELVGVNYIGCPKYSEIDYSVFLRSKLILNRVWKQNEYIVTTDFKAHY